MPALINAVAWLLSDILRLKVLFLRSSSALRAENLVLRIQLARYFERGIKPRRVDHVTREGVVGLSAPKALTQPARPSAKITWRVVVLNNDHFLLPTSAIMDQALRETLTREAPDSVDFFGEALDSWHCMQAAAIGDKDVGEIIRLKNAGNDTFIDVTSKLCYNRISPVTYRVFKSPSPMGRCEGPRWGN